MPDTDRSDRMEKIVALCKRRGYIFQNSDIYGGQNGFWDYGPLGVELKRNVREAWWREMVSSNDPLFTPEGAPRPFGMVGVETAIIMHPQVWKCIGHYDLFNDPMRKCHDCGHFVRADQLWSILATSEWVTSLVQTFTPVSGDIDTPRLISWAKKKGKRLAPNLALVKNPEVTLSWLATRVEGQPDAPPDMTELVRYLATEQLHQTGLQEPCPRCGGVLADPTPFNLMFKTIIGALGTEDDAAFLRPETAQGMFVNFKNILDSTRVKLPFGVAQIGKSFRNEITPRNFTFRSREFEQMEMEFFCSPQESREWYGYWRNRRMQWYIDLGISSENLILRDHEPEELAHYSVGTADVEYAFPFLPEGEYGELEGIAHRGDFDLRSHMEGKLTVEDGCLVLEKDENGQPKYRGSGKDLTYFDDEAFERDKEGLGVTSFKKYVESRSGESDPGAPYRFIPHVIEPAAGADRATLAFLCDAYHEDEQPDDKGKMQSRVVLRLHPRLAPIKAAVFPLLKKDGHPEKAREIYAALKQAGIACTYDEQAAIGKRYRRQDEIGTPWCITVDGDTMTDGTVTLRDRDSLEQIRLPAEEIAGEIQQRMMG